MSLDFVQSVVEQNAALKGIYDPVLVLLSPLAAYLGLFAGMGVVQPIRRELDPLRRRIWFVFGAIAFANGIFVMHFLGLLAFKLPVLVQYDLVATLLSGLLAFWVAAWFLYQISQENQPRGAVWLSGLIGGAGMGLIHFTGMMAMRLEAQIRFHPTWFALSLLVAIGLSVMTVRLRSLFPRLAAAITGGPGQHLAPIRMAAAVTCLHFIVMESTLFIPGAVDHGAWGVVMDPVLLGTGLATLFCLLGIAYLWAIYFGYNRPGSEKCFQILDFYFKKDQRKIFIRVLGAVLAILLTVTWSVITIHDLSNPPSLHPHPHQAGEIELVVATLLFCGVTVSLFASWIITLFLISRRDAHKATIDLMRELEFQKQALDEHGIVSTTDVRGNITYVNEKFIKISGYSRQELIGQNHRILKSEEHSPAFYQTLWRTIASGRSWHGEVKNRAKDGSYYWVRATVVPFLDDHGKPFQFVSIRTDITEQKNAEEQSVRALSEQSLLKQLLSLAMLDLPVGELLNRALLLILANTSINTLGQGAVFVMRKDGSGLERVAQFGMHPRIVECCRMADEGFCLCDRVAAVRDVLFVDRPDFQLALQDNGVAERGYVGVPILSREALLGVLIFTVPVGYRERGSERELLLTIGNTLGMIMERLDAAAALTKLSTAVRHSSVSVVVTDASGVIEYVNEKFTSTTGYAPNEVVGRKTSLLGSGKTSQEQYADLWSTLLAGTPWYGRLLNKRKSGELYWEQLSIAPLKGSDGRVTNFVSVGENVSEQMKLLEERDDALCQVNSSIQYASRIQRSILPRPQALDRVFSEYFVLWEPRDVVGGDMYWYRSWGQGALIVLGDCTGHGVPGAFMTLISNGALDQAYLETPPGDPAALLQRMHQLIQFSLGQDHEGGSDSDDGLEAGVCYINADNTLLTYAGARFDLFVVEDGQVDIIKGASASLGYRHVSSSVKFNNTVIHLSPGQRFYLTSDGLIDQVGGEKKRGFGKRRFMELITSLAETAMAKQGILVQQALQSYQGDQKRRDDVAVIGFKVHAATSRSHEKAVETLDPALAVGYDPIDEDHKRLIGLVGGLNDAIVLGHDKNLILELLQELIHYTEWHFRHEERLMQINGYPDMDRHKDEHQTLIDSVVKVQADFKEGHADVSANLMKILLSWLYDHIHLVDQHLADYLNSAAAEGISSEIFFQLDDTLLVGHVDIDEDHKRLVGLVNQLHTANHTRAGREGIASILDELVDYTGLDHRFVHCHPPSRSEQPEL